VGLNVKHSLLLRDLNQTVRVGELRHGLEIRNCMKTNSVFFELLHTNRRTDGRTDEQGEVTRHVCVNAPQNGHLPMDLGVPHIKATGETCTRKGRLRIRSKIWSRSQWPRGPRLRSEAERLLGSRVRIPPGAWIFVSCECLCCQVVVSATGRSLVQRSPADW
jgi:hypothetical protein